MSPKLNWQLFIVLLTLVITSYGLVNVISYVQTTNRVALVGDSLKLKAPPEKIVQYTEFDQNGLPLPIPSPDNNNNIVQYIYATNKEVPPTTYQGLTEDISKRTANAQIFLKEVKPLNDQEVLETYVGKFYSGINFNQEGDKWYQTESATTTKTAFLLQTKPTILTHVKQLLGQRALADTYYSGAGDGRVFSYGSTNWSPVHSGSLSLDGDHTSEDFKAESIDGLGYSIFRAFIPFNTSSIPANSTINSATLNVYVISASSNTADGYDYFNVVQTYQASNSSLANSDFGLCGDSVTNPTTGSTNKTASSFTTSTYNSFTLNSTGLTWVAKSGDTSTCGVTAGYTCLGIREAHDMVNVAPPSGKVTSLRVSSAEDTGENYPYLTVTYSITVSSLKINGGTLKVNGGTVNVR